MYLGFTNGWEQFWFWFDYAELFYVSKWLKMHITRQNEIQLYLFWVDWLIDEKETENLVGCPFTLISAWLDLWTLWAHYGVY